MMQVVDILVVSVALAASLTYAVLALGPRALRRRILSGVGAWLRRLPVQAATHLSERALRAAQSGAGACGGCDTCGSTQPAAPVAGSEVRVPIAQIGRPAIGRPAIGLPTTERSVGERRAPF